MQVNANFNARLDRIAQNKAAATGRIRLHVGDQEVFVRSLESLKPRETIAVGLLRNLAHLISFVLAFGLGMLAYALSTAARMQLTDPTAKDPILAGFESNELLGGLLALAISLGLAQVFRLSSRTLGAAQTAGVFAAIVSLHNLAFWTPELASMVFTPNWVETKHASAVPNSLIYRSLVVPLHA
ncbi:hypothetical protein C8J30_101354 [Rhodobacter viridis]|uniref:Uncharacterized protein n=1 Tax=Rhodobacter viridis TaxID=1054202 RepID=A0A318U3A0_9RHOB|nr:hypothetical protein [Rhodobacter viridis]PYF12970.1 hypothetical protein C8J30_101354 [Rhodobacter viridis]